MMMVFIIITAKPGRGQGRDDGGLRPSSGRCCAKQDKARKAMAMTVFTAAPSAPQTTGHRERRPEPQAGRDEKVRA